MRRYVPAVKWHELVSIRIATEETRTVVLNDLDPDRIYIIREAPHGKTVIQGSGEKLMNDGFSVEIQDEYDGRVFEVGME